MENRSTPGPFEDTGQRLESDETLCLGFETLDLCNLRSDHLAEDGWEGTY